MKRLSIIPINGKTYFLDERLRELRNIKDPKDAKRFQSGSDLQTYVYWTEQLQAIVGKSVTSAEMVFDESFDGWAPVLRFSTSETLCSSPAGIWG